MTMIGSQPGELVAVAQCLLLSHGGFTALSGAMDRHRDRLASLPHATWSYRAIGVALLAMSLLPCLRVWPASVGCVTWCLMLSVSAGWLVIVLQYAPRMARWSLWLAPAAALGWLAVDRLSATL